MKRLLSILALCLLPATPALAACTGSSPNWSTTSDETSVGTCISNAAASGDTITIASTSSTWTTGVTISGKSLTLQGGGIGNTVITCDNGANPCLAVTASAANFVRVTGISFNNASVTRNGGSMISFSGTQHEIAFRMDHSALYDGNIGCSNCLPSNRLAAVNNVFGLFDHMQFKRDAFGQGIDLEDLGPDNGMTAWTYPDDLGTNKALYVEDSTFVWVACCETAFDQYSSSIVFRFNTLTDVGIGDHGLDSGGRRGAKKMEAYGNVFFNDTGGNLRANQLRSGMLFFWGNEFHRSANPSSWDATITLYRAGGCANNVSPFDYVTRGGTFNNITCQPDWNLEAWGQLDGTQYDMKADGSGFAVANTVGRFRAGNPDTYCTSGADCTRYGDGNGTNGYPGRDQPGVGHDQASVPVRQWNNIDTWSGNAVTMDADDVDCSSPLCVGGTHATSWVAHCRDNYFTGNAIQSSSSLPWNGTCNSGTGIGGGWGTLINRPTCSVNGTHYFVTNAGSWNTSVTNPQGVQQSGASGVLQTCNGGTWSDYYTPYTYPHPLQAGGGGGGGGNSGSGTKRHRFIRRDQP